MIHELLGALLLRGPLRLVPLISAVRVLPKLAFTQETLRRESGIVHVVHRLLHVVKINDIGRQNVTRDYSFLFLGRFMGWCSLFVI